MNKILKNISWLLFDKIFILILQFFIGVKVANYYGSESFGFYTYIVTIVSFSSILFEILNNGVIKKFFNNENFNYIIYNINFFRNILAIIIFAGTLISGKFLIEDKLFYYILVLLCFDNILTVSTVGIEIYFQYKLNSKNIVIVNNFIKLFSYIIQYLGMMLGYSIIMMPIIRCAGSIIRILALKYFYKRNYLKNRKLKEKLDTNLILKIIKESFYLWTSYVAFFIYTQIDKVMLGNYLGNKEVGIYSIAVQLTQILAILISPIQISLFPKMVNLYKKDNKKYYNFYLIANTGITQLYLLACASSIIVVKILFPYIFSKEYFSAITVYSILTISIFFKANGALQTGHMTIKEITKKSCYKTFLGLFINIILNYFLIKKYGINGAAIATSITQCLALFIFDFFIKEYREQAIIQLKSFNPFNLKNISKYR